MMADRFRRTLPINCISSIFRKDNLTWGISFSRFVRIQEKRMTYLFVIIQCRRVPFILLGRRSDRHGRNG